MRHRSTTTSRAVGTLIAATTATLVCAAAAYAAGLGANSVGTVHLKPQAVTAPKLAANSVNTAKVAPNALTGADLRENTLAQVPSAKHAQTASRATSVTGQYSFSRRITQMPSAGTVDAARALATAMPLGEDYGPFSLKAKCFQLTGSAAMVEVYLYSEDEFTVMSAYDNFDGTSAGAYLKSGTPEGMRRLAAINIADSAAAFRRVEKTAAVWARSGALMHVDVTAAINNNSPAGASGPYGGTAESCWVMGEVTLRDAS